jgi:hypothetical protein
MEKLKFCDRTVDTDSVSAKTKQALVRVPPELDQALAAAAADYLSSKNLFIWNACSNELMATHLSQAAQFTQPPNYRFNERYFKQQVN